MIRCDYLIRGDGWSSVPRSKSGTENSAAVENPRGRARAHPNGVAARERDDAARDCARFTVLNETPIASGSSVASMRRLSGGISDEEPFSRIVSRGADFRIRFGSLDFVL